jgi:regulatory protein
MDSKISYLEAKSKVEALCAYQEKCQFDIDKKLFDWGFNQEERDQLISHLISYNFINEERFASAFTSGKFKIKKWGRIKIKSHLKAKNISEYSIKKGLSEINSSEYWDMIMYLANRKVKDISTKQESVWEKKGKIYRFLASKGFESELINEAISDLNFK